MRPARATPSSAAARCWRDGQKRRCYTYRLLTTGSIEERIYQRQLSKEGLQNVVEDKDQVNSLATKDLKRLFRYRGDTISDTHDQLKCRVCSGLMRARADTCVDTTTLTPARAARCAKLLEQLIEHVRTGSMEMKEKGAMFLDNLCQQPKAADT